MMPLICCILVIKTILRDKIIALVNSPEDEIVFQSIKVETIVPIKWMEKLIESSLIYEDVTEFFLILMLTNCQF